MFVAPLALPVSKSAGRPLRARPRTLRPTSLPAANLRPLMLTWLLLGTAALMLVPALRSDPRFGATLPFWLVGAPAIDLAWLMRARLVTALRSAWTSRRAYRARQQARRARFAQSALRSRLDRSSRK